MDSQPATTDRLTAYEDRTSWAMVFLSLVFLTVYALQVLWDPAGARGLEAVAGAIWAVFIVDLSVRVWLAPRRLHYLLRHPIDVLAVIVPAFRLLRVLRILTAGQWLIRSGSKVAVGRTAGAIGLTTAFLSFVGSLAMLDVERDAPQATIHTLGDALWWSYATMTTVGYGDTYPVTTQGRLIALIMMLLGISLLGIVSATMASTFLARVRGEQEDETTVMLRKLDALESALAEVRAELAHARASAQPGPGIDQQRNSAGRTGVVPG